MMGHIEDNKALVHRYIDAYNAKNLAAMDDIYAATYIDHAQPPGQPQQPPGPEFKKQIFALFFQSFPDAHLTIEDLIAEDDRVVVRATMSGTHKRAFLGIRPQGRRFSIPSITIFLIRDALVTDSWGILDTMSLTQQIQGPKRVEFLWGGRPSSLRESPVSEEAPQLPVEPPYWARWEYSEQQWKLFDHLDWGLAYRKFIGSLCLFTLLFVIAQYVFWSFLVPNYVLPHSVFRVNGWSYHIERVASAPADVIFMLMIFFLIFPLLIFFLLSLYFIIRPFSYARERHEARKSGSRRVTIQNLSTFNNQGLWQADLYVPLQATLMKLFWVNITGNPPVLRFRRSHPNHDFSASDTVCVLVPHGHEEEARQLVGRFRSETIVSYKKDDSPREPRGI